MFIYVVGKNDDSECTVVKYRSESNKEPKTSSEDPFSCHGNHLISKDVKECSSDLFATSDTDAGIGDDSVSSVLCDEDDLDNSQVKVNGSHSKIR